MAPQNYLTILSILFAVAGGIVVLVAGTILLVRVGSGIGRGISAVFGRIFEFIGGVFSDATRLVGAVIAAVLFVPLALANVVIGRWSAANHYAEALRRELGIVTCRTVSIVARRPMRLLFLDGMLEGVEQRAAEAVRQAPGADRPRRGMEFAGFEITGSLPAGGSGAKLYIARPDDATRRRLAGQPDEVVIKSFALAEGSSLPQIVRESRSLDAARRLGLVLAHELDDTRFWYAMPYHPGDNLSIVVRHAHGFSGEAGLERQDLDRLLGYAVDLVGTLDRYHQGGMWHKDVKPDNIIVHDGSAHLVDFGLVSSLQSAMTLTTHGTEYFRDPEMVRMAMKGVKVHEVNGAKFDVYGAGAVLYFMLENTFPGHGGLSRFERTSPEALRMIVRRAMADYAHRYESAAEMLADLETVAAAADPWSVKPAMLPSMGGEAAVAAPAPPVATVASARRTPPPPPPISNPGPHRPAIEVTGWWTGGYATASENRRRAHEQVTAARRRAATRRQAVSRAPGSRVSVMLAVLVLGVISSIVGMALLVGNWDAIDGPGNAMARARQAQRDAASEARRMANEVAMLTVVSEPLMQGSSVVVIDDQGSVDEDRTVRLAPEIEGRLATLGWNVVDDAEIEARIRAVPVSEWTRRDRWNDGGFGVDLIYRIRSGLDADGRTVLVTRYESGQESEVTIDVDRENGDTTFPGRPEATAEFTESSPEPASRIVEIRLDDRLARIGERLGRLGEAVGERVGGRFIEIDWTSDAAATIVSSHGVVLHDN